MSVIVKGMQMPKSCMECPMFSGAGCKATMKMFSELTNVAVRVKGCSLVEIPEKHGDLIDRNKLMKDLTDIWYGKITATDFLTIKLVKQQEIVIESEE